VVVFGRSLTAQETIVLTRPAIWIHEPSGGFREIFILREGESVFAPMVTDNYILFSVGIYGEYIR
jgi:hypothetical protein